MKQIFTYSILFVFCLCQGSCKSSQRSPKKNNLVSIEDFRSLNQSIIGDSKAVKLSEVVDVRMETVSLSPWALNLKNPSWTNYLKWKTEVEDKTLFLMDSINSEPFFDVSYFNPLGMRWDLMTQCSMWLYALDKAGKISKRKIKKDEIIHERVSDSICMIRLNIHENLTGKILVRKYAFLSPYYTIETTSLSPFLRVTEPDLYKIEPWIFQKDIPLLYGKYEIRLPEGGYDGGDENNNVIKSKVVKLGNGEINVQSEREYVTLSNEAGRSYKATKVTATVSNVLPLPKGSNAQPLGIEITREWEK